MLQTSAQQNADLWSRANNVLNCSYIRDATSEEAELYLEIASLRNQENRVFSAETKLKSDLIQGYSARKIYLEKLNKIFEISQQLQTKKIKNEIREKIIEGNDQFTFSATQIITPNK